VFRSSCQVDESHTVGEIVASLGAKLGIENVANYSLYVEGSSQACISSYPLLLTVEQTEHRWLRRALTLGEQGATAADTTFGFNKLPAAEVQIDPSNPEQLDELFAEVRVSSGCCVFSSLQASGGIISGRQPCALEDAIEVCRC
jgi:hypothetical protein